MKFATHTNMMTASWSDIEMALAQGSIASVAYPTGSRLAEDQRAFTLLSTGGSTFGVGDSTYAVKQQRTDLVSLTTASIMLLISAILFACSVYRFKTLRTEYSGGTTVRKPLMSSRGRVKDPLKGVMA